MRENAEERHQSHQVCSKTTSCLHTVEPNIVAVPQSLKSFLLPESTNSTELESLGLTDPMQKPFQPQAPQTLPVRLACSICASELNPVILPLASEGGTWNFTFTETSSQFNH